MDAKICPELAAALANKETAHRLGRILAEGRYGDEVVIEGQRYEVKRFSLADVLEKHQDT
jgi:hypothetical protein